MDIKTVAAKYLASRIRSTGELREHLKKKGYQEDEIQQVVHDFTKLHYLNDENYCEQYIRYAQNKGRGATRIWQELAKKGIDRDIIQFAIEDYVDQEEEFQRALEQAEKTLAGKPLDEKMKGRIGRRLTSLGYSMDVIYKVLGRV